MTELGTHTPNEDAMRMIYTRSERRSANERGKFREGDDAMYDAEFTRFVESIQVHERVKVVAHLDAVADWYAERSEGYAKISHTSMVIAMNEMSKSYRHTARSVGSGVHA